MDPLHAHHAEPQAARADHRYLSGSLADGRGRLDLRAWTNVIPDTAHGCSSFINSIGWPSLGARRASPFPSCGATRTGTIVSNESADILRMFNSAFDDLGAKGGDYYPKELRAEIDEVNSRIYAHLNNGVYEAGFAGSQAAQ